jgi:hypothetical protein
MKFTTKRVLWIFVVVIILCFHLLVGTLVAIATVFYWFLDKRMPLPTQTDVRLSDTPETQSAFRKAVSAVLAESGIAPEVMPSLADGTISGKKFCDTIGASSQETWVFLGLKPEQVQQLLNLGTLLDACSRLGVKQEGLQELVVTLLSPKTPTTPETADGMKEVVASFGRLLKG